MLLTTALVFVLAALTPDAQCPAGEPPRGDLGIRSVECNCTVRPPRGQAPADWRFRGLPVVREIDPAGPAAGVLQPGDTIRAIDGVSLLTSDGGARFANVAPQRPVRLTISRGGRDRDVTVRSAALCPEDARLLERRTPAASRQSPAPPARGVERSAPVASVESPAPPSRSSRGLSVVPSAGMELPWFGWALACSGCGWEQEYDDARPRWESSAPPVVHAIEPGGPAARAGIQAGDKLIAVAGQPITSREGGARLGGAEPGRALDVRIERGGRMYDLRIAPGPRPADAPLAPRYRGSLGPAEVEVDSAEAVSVTLSAAGNELIITTPTTTVRVRVKGAR